MISPKLNTLLQGPIFNIDIWWGVVKASTHKFGRGDQSAAKGQAFKHLLPSVFGYSSPGNIVGSLHLRQFPRKGDNPGLPATGTLSGITICPLEVTAISCGNSPSTQPWFPSKGSLHSTTGWEEIQKRASHLAPFQRNSAGLSQLLTPFGNFWNPCCCCLTGYFSSCQEREVLLHSLLLSARQMLTTGLFPQPNLCTLISI